MYEVSIIKNESKEYLIHSASTDQDAPHITGTIKQGINCFNSFTFTIYSNNPYYDIITPFRTVIKVFNVILQRYEFVGRILTSTEELKENGLFYITYVCESDLAYLIDSVQRYKKFENITIKEYLEKLLEVHNKNVNHALTRKDFLIGDIEINETGTFVNDYTTTWENINKNILDVYGGELYITYDENNNRYLNYKNKIGKTSATEIFLKKNIKDLSRKWKFDDFGSVFIFLGKKKDNTDERITIESVNNGKDYLFYDEGVRKYGYIEKPVIFDDVETASELLKKGQEYIESIYFNSNLSLTALELYYLGLDEETFEVGNYYRVKAEIFNIDYMARVIEKTIVIENPLDNKLTFDEKDLDIKTYNAKKNKQMINAVETSAKQIENINNNYIPVAVYNQFVDETNKKIAELEEKINNNTEGGTTNG